MQFLMCCDGERLEGRKVVGLTLVGLEELQEPDLVRRKEVS